MRTTNARTAGMVRRGTTAQRMVEQRQYFLCDEVLAVFMNELLELSRELEGLWRGLTERQPSGADEIDGVAALETRLYVLRTRADTIQRHLDKLARRLPKGD